MSFTPRTELPGLEPEARRALVEVQTAVARECKRLESRGSRPKRRTTELVEAGSVEAKPGEVVRVQPGDEDVTVLLPEPSSENDGQDIIVSFEGDGTATGKVKVVPKNGTCTKPGITTLNAPGSYSFTSTGGGAVAKRQGSAVPVSPSGAGGGPGWSGPAPITADDLPVVANANLADMAAGTVKGRQTDAVTGAPVDLTGAELSELLRRATVQTITASGDMTVTLADDTTVLLFSTTASVRVQNIISNNASGREIAIEHVRASGTGLVTLQHQSVVGGGGVDFLLPNNGDIVLGHRDSAVIRYRPSFWRLQARSGTFASRFPGQPIYDVMAPPFNAAGNGVTDDTAAINAAIAAANAEPGTIYLGAAHLVTSALTPITGTAVCVRGRGEREDGTVITATGATPYDVVTFSLSSTCYIERVHIVGPGTWASEGWGIRVDRGLRTRIVECRVTGTYGAVEIYSSIVTELWRTIATEILGPVGFYARGDAVDGDNHSLSFHSCSTGDDVSGGTIAWYKHGSHAHTFTMSNCGALEGGYGLLVEDDTPGTGSRPLFTRTVNFQADHCAISGICLKGGSAGRFTATFVTSTTSGPGIDIQSTYSGNWEICGGAVNSVGGHGVAIGVGDGIIQGMQIGDVIAGSDCINVAASVTDFNIVGNSCGDMFAANSVARYGINIGAGCDNYAVVGNRCIGNTTGAILNTPGTAETRVVANNVPQTLGSAGAVQTVSASGDITVTLADDTGVLLIESTANVRLQALISNNLEGREVIIEHVRTSGTGVLTIQHQSGGAGGGIDFLLPNAADVILGNRAGAIIRMRPTFWRLQAMAAGVFGSDRQGMVPVAGATTTNVLLASGAFGTVATAGITDAAVTLAKMANLAAGTVIGRQTDAGSGVPVALTGAEQAENFRRATVQTVTGLSGDITVTLADDTTVLLIESTANIRLQAITHSNSSGRELVIEHVRTSGTGELTLQNQSGVAGSGSDLLLPNSADMILGTRFAVNFRYRPSFWRLQGQGMGVFSAEQQGLVPIGGATTTNVLRADATFGTVATAGIADAAVTLAKQANLAQSTIIGRAAGAGTGVPTALTAAQVRAIVGGSMVARTVYESGSGDHVMNAATVRAVVTVVGAGAGGGGIEGGGTGSGHAVGGGGGAGARLVLNITTNLGTHAYVVGAAGAGVSGLAGTSGDNSSFHDGTGTRTANGGSGGQPQTLGTLTAIVSGAAGGTRPSSGGSVVERTSGNPGEAAVRLALEGLPLGIGGNGGAGPWGGAGRALTSNDVGGTGGAAGGYGSGGGGAYSTATTTDRTGGAGFAGVVIVEEYS
jgi:hypothetical protein